MSAQEKIFRWWINVIPGHENSVYQSFFMMPTINPKSTCFTLVASLHGWSLVGQRQFVLRPCTVGDRQNATKKQRGSRRIQDTHVKPWCHLERGSVGPVTAQAGNTQHWVKGWTTLFDLRELGRLFWKWCNDRKKLQGGGQKICVV